MKCYADLNFLPGSKLYNTQTEFKFGIHIVSSEIDLINLPIEIGQLAINLSNYKLYIYSGPLNLWIKQNETPISLASCEFDIIPTNIDSNNGYTFIYNCKYPVYFNLPAWKSGLSFTFINTGIDKLSIRPNYFNDEYVNSSDVEIDIVGVNSSVTLLATSYNCWGIINNFGTLNCYDSYRLTRPRDFYLKYSNILCCGYYNIFAIRSDGGIASCGNSTYTIPITPANGFDNSIIQLSSRYLDLVGVRSDGSLATSKTSITTIDMSQESGYYNIIDYDMNIYGGVAIRADGTIIINYSGYPTITCKSERSPFRILFLSTYQVYWINRDGSVEYFNWQYPQTPPKVIWKYDGIRKPIDCAGSYDVASMILFDDGSYLTNGSIFFQNMPYQIIRTNLNWTHVMPTDPIKTIGGGYNQILAVAKSGLVYNTAGYYGYNTQLHNPELWRNRDILFATASPYFFTAIKSDGTVISTNSSGGTPSVANGFYNIGI